MWCGKRKVKSTHKPEPQNKVASLLSITLIKHQLKSKRVTVILDNWYHCRMPNVEYFSKQKTFIFLLVYGRNVTELWNAIVKSLEGCKSALFCQALLMYADVVSQSTLVLCWLTSPEDLSYMLRSVTNWSWIVPCYPYSRLHLLMVKRKSFVIAVYPWKLFKEREMDFIDQILPPQELNWVQAHCKGITVKRK